MIRAKTRAGICALALGAVSAFTGFAAADSAHASDHHPAPSRHSAPQHCDHGKDHAVPGMVAAWTEIYVRDAPSVHAPATSTLPAGSHIWLFCQTAGDHVEGTSTWYFDDDAHGWVSAAHVHPTAAQPPDC